jgi:hypothetical protein
MKRALPSLLATGLVAGLIGCQAATEPPAVTGTTTSNTTNAVSSDVTLVSLSVPNMT